MLSSMYGVAHFFAGILRGDKKSKDNCSAALFYAGGDIIYGGVCNIHNFRLVEESGQARRVRQPPADDKSGCVG